MFRVYSTQSQSNTGTIQTSIWPYAQSYRRSEYRWRPLLKTMTSESSVISFLVPCRSLADAHCSSAVQQRCQYSRTQDLDAKSVRRQEPLKCIHSVPVQETAKHRAKFGWLLLSDIGAVMKPVGENLLECPKLVNRSQPLLGGSSPYCENMFNKFFRLSIHRNVNKTFFTRPRLLFQDQDQAFLVKTKTKTLHLKTKTKTKSFTFSDIMSDNLAKDSYKQCTWLNTEVI